MSVKRQVFYSFHYANDVRRVQQIRNIGALDDNKPVSPNDWEEVKKKGAAGIKEWINVNMNNRSCVVVLIGEETSKRPWVKYEIQKAYDDRRAILGVHIYRLNDPSTGYGTKGENPFDQFGFLDKNGGNIKLICKTPSYYDAYNDIKENLEDWIEEAILLKSKYPPK